MEQRKFEVTDEALELFLQFKVGPIWTAIPWEEITKKVEKERHRLEGEKEVIKAEKGVDPDAS